MSAHFADSALSFTVARSSQPTSTAPSNRSGLRRAIQWLAEMPRRRAVINELDALSDHELADIGLARADVARVFDASFARQRNA